MAAGQTNRLAREGREQPVQRQQHTLQRSGGGAGTVGVWVHVQQLRPSPIAQPRVERPAVQGVAGGWERAPVQHRPLRPGAATAPTAPPSCLRESGTRICVVESVALSTSRDHARHRHAHPPGFADIVAVPGLRALARGGSHGRKGDVMTQCCGDRARWRGSPMWRARASVTLTHSPE